MTAIIDYGVGNLFSLRCSLAALGAESVVTRDPAELARADRLILPGVGAFGDAAERLRATGLVPALREQTAGGKPLLGICLGMQLLLERGFEFGEHAGLGFIPGDILPLAENLRAAGLALKVPQIGWNGLELLRPDCPLFRDTRPGDCVYFVHSFHAVCPPEFTAARCEYGVPVTAAVWRGNVYGTQFHPEKSGGVGLAILKAFTEI